MQRDQYQQKALECVRAAERCRDPIERVRLLGLARQFALLARHVGSWRDCGPGACAGRPHENEAAALATASLRSGAAVVVSDASGSRSG